MTLVTRNENLKVRLTAEGTSSEALSGNRYGDVLFSPRQTTVAIPALGSLAFGSVTGSYVQVLAANAYSGRMRGVILKNDTDKTLIFSLDGGVTDHIPLGTGDGLFIPFTQLNVWIANGAIKVKHAGSAPTSGSAYANVIPEA